MDTKKMYAPYEKRKISGFFYTKYLIALLGTISLTTDAYYISPVNMLENERKAISSLSPNKQCLNEKLTDLPPEGKIVLIISFTENSVPFHGEIISSTSEHSTSEKVLNAYLSCDYKKSRWLNEVFWGASKEFEYTWQAGDATNDVNRCFNLLVNSKHRKSLDARNSPPEIEYTIYDTEPFYEARIVSSGGNTKLDSILFADVTRCLQKPELRKEMKKGERQVIYEK